MASATRGEALRAARATLGARRLAEAELRKAAGTPIDARVDIFLSHSSEDAEVIAGIKTLLEDDGLTVYVDWLEDPQIDRRRATATTADLLRKRMRSSGYLVYASPRASSRSKWMPWELGYFDGLRPNRVGILPIVERPQDTFVGLEHLRLYPIVERVSLRGVGVRSAHVAGPGHLTGTSYGTELQALARS